MANKKLLRLLWVGKTRERWAAEAVDKYLRALGNTARVEVVEIKEHKAAASGSQAALKKEAEAIGASLSGAPYILLDEAGTQLDSAGLANLLRDRASADFVIGGPYGADETVKKGAAQRLALSKMTLTHEMARIVLLEQLYRAMMINQGRSYHH